MIKGQAARFEALLDRAHVPVTMRITAGRHDWADAIDALARALDFLATGWGSGGGWARPVGHVPRTRPTGLRP